MSIHYGGRGPGHRARVQGNRNPSATGTLKAKLVADEGDVTALFMSDSTGDSSTEWIHLVAEDIADDYPTYTVVYHPWDTTDYGTPETISTGSGANTLNVYNCAISGSTLDTVMGALFPAAVGDLSPDAIVISHGHNYTTLADYVLRGRFVGALEQIMLEHPTVPVAMVLQNPRRDDTLLDQIVDQITEYAQDRGDIQLIDVHSLFILAGKDSGLYADSVHPNATGQALYRQAWNAAWDASVAAERTISPAWIATAGTNIITNGDFAAFGGATPDSWTKGGNGTLSKELTIIYPGSAHSVKLVNGTTSTSISQIISSTAYRGLELTLRVRMRIEAAGNLNTGRIRIFDNGSGSPLVASNPGSTGLCGFRELCISGYTIPSDATQVGVYVYANSSGTTTGEIYIDEVMLNVSDIPRGIA